MTKRQLRAKRLGDLLNLKNHNTEYFYDCQYDTKCPDRYFMRVCPAAGDDSASEDDITVHFAKSLTDLRSEVKRRIASGECFLDVIDLDTGEKLDVKTEVTVKIKSITRSPHMSY